MPNPRFITAMLVCAGVLAMTAGAVVAQQGRTAPPQAPKAKTATTKPAPAARTPQPIVVDPMFDATLIAIREKVTFDEEQWAALLERYRVLRVDQRVVVEANRAEMGRLRAEERARRKAFTEGGADQGDRPPVDKSATGRSPAIDFEARFQPLNAKFIADVRGIIDESQHEAWMACAEGLDLTTQPRYFGQRPEMRWRNPALGPKVGEMAPDFTLESVDGKKVTLSSLRGTPVALLFGSTSSPDFRRSIEQAEILQRAFAAKVRWVIVYTFEAHPADGWALKLNERNGIEIPKHKSYEERLALAEKVRDEMAPSCLVLADDLKDTVTKRYFGHPNRFYMLDAEGRVQLRQIWFDERATTETLYKMPTARSAATP